MVLGVRFDSFDMVTALSKASEYLLSGHKPALVYTPNPEMLILATKYDVFKKVLNTSDINLCDGMGIYLASFGSLPRVPGADFAEALMIAASKKGKRVFLLGTKSDKILSHAVDYLKNNIPGIQIVGTATGPDVAINESGNIVLDEIENQALIATINDCAPDILLVAFGQMKQELWLNTYCMQCRSLKLAMGVGGTLDYWAGNVKRAPLFFRRIGLEWLWRLSQQPSRINRIINAVLIFSIYIIKDLWKRKK